MAVKEQGNAGADGKETALPSARTVALGAHAHTSVTEGSTATGVPLLPCSFGSRSWRFIPCPLLGTYPGAVRGHLAKQQQDSSPEAKVPHASSAGGKTVGQANAPGRTQVWIGHMTMKSHRKRGQLGGACIL